MSRINLVVKSVPRHDCPIPDPPDVPGNVRVTWRCDTCHNVWYYGERYIFRGSQTVHCIGTHRSGWYRYGGTSARWLRRERKRILAELKTKETVS